MKPGSILQFIVVRLQQISKDRKSLFPLCCHHANIIASVWFQSHANQSSKHSRRDLGQKIKCMYVWGVDFQTPCEKFIFTHTPWARATSVSHYATLIIDCVSFKQAILSPTLWLLPWDAKWHLEMCMGAEEHLANVPMGAVQENDRADANRKPHKSLYLRTTIERDIKYMALKMVAVWNNWPCNISF